MATKLHNQMTGADLHPNTIDGTTGTELTVASQTTYDTRYVRTIGGTVTPTSNTTTTLKVTKADGTTQVFDIDTTNARVGIGTVTPNAPLSLGSGVGNKIALFDSGASSMYGFGIASSLMQIFANTSTDRVGIGYGGTSGSFVETLSVKGSNVGVGTTVPRSLLDVTGTGTTEISIDSPTANQAQVAFYKAGVAKWQFYIPGNSNDWRVFGNGADRLTIQNDGKTGVGITPTSMLHINGAIATAITTSAKTGAYTATTTDSTILADASGGTFQITLPTAVGCQGRQYTIKRTGATNNLTVGGTSAQTLDGATTKTLGSQYATLTVQSDNANWQILSTLGTVS